MRLFFWNIDKNMDLAPKVGEVVGENDNYGHLSYK